MGIMEEHWPEHFFPSSLLGWLTEHVKQECGPASGSQEDLRPWAKMWDLICREEGWVRIPNKIRIEWKVLLKNKYL